MRTTTRLVSVWRRMTRIARKPTSEADGDAAERDGDEFERRVAEREGAAGGDPEGDRVEDEGGAVVDHRLAFDQQPHPLGAADAAEDRDRGDGVGGGEDGAEHGRLGPAQARHGRVGDDRDDGGGEEDEGDREQGQRPHHRAQLARRGAPAGGEDQRRQEDEEDRVGVELDGRQAGDEGDREAADDEHDRRRHLAELGKPDQQRRRQHQDQDRLDVVHVGITSCRVDDTLTPQLDADDHIRGELGRPLELVMFGDFQCPFCLGAQSVLRRVHERLGDRLVFAFRHLPIPERHPLAPEAAEASEAAAAQGSFWEYHDALFAAQPKLSRETMLAVGRDLGLDAERMASGDRLRRPPPADRARHRLGRGERRHRHPELLRQRQAPLRRLRRLLAGRGAGGRRRNWLSARRLLRPNRSNEGRR